MTEKQQELAKVLLADPAVESISSFIGADGTNTTLNSGRIQINLKPLEQRGISATEVIHRLEPQAGEGRRASRFTCSPCRISRSTIASAAPSTSTRWKIRTQNELNTVAHDLVATFKRLPELADVVTDQQLGGAAESLVIDRATASRFGITPQTIDNTLYDAFGQRQINTLYTQLNQYHVILEAEPKFQLDPRNAARYLHPVCFEQQLFVNRRSASNTAGSSSGAGAGASASAGNALLTPSFTYGVSSASIIDLRACQHYKPGIELDQRQLELRALASIHLRHNDHRALQHQHEHQRLIERQHLYERNHALDRQLHIWLL